MPSRIDVRVSDKLKKQVDDIQKKMNVPFPDTVRELLEIGVFVKEKQLSDVDSKKENWEEYFQKIALRSMESRLILGSLYKAVFNKETSKFANATDELRDIMVRAKAGRDKDIGRKDDEIQSD